MKNDLILEIVQLKKTVDLTTSTVSTDIEEVIFTLTKIEPVVIRTGFVIHFN